MSELTYTEVGATRDERLPPGYHRVRVRGRVGTGRATFDTVGSGLLAFSSRRWPGLRVEASAERPAPGVEIVSTIGFWPLRMRVPCRVVWTVDDGVRRGFAYGTLPGHPFSGEESFVAEIDADEAVWFTVTSFSRPARWYNRWLGPLNGVTQRSVARGYVAAARKLGASGS